jgi:hypothetical protein
MIRPLARSLKTGLVSLTAATGSHCPVSGTWIPEDQHSEKRNFSEGSVMPAHNGQTVVWTYIGYT